MDYYFARFLSLRLGHLRTSDCARKCPSRKSSKTQAKKLKTLLQSKIYSQILFFFCLSFSCFAQNIKGTIATKKEKCNIGIFISGGINSTQYYSNNFFSYLFTETSLNKPYEYSNYSSPVISGTTFPAKFNHSKSVECPILNVGLDLISDKEKKIKLNHIIEASYMKFSGVYASSDSYSESGLFAPEGTYSLDVRDTVKSKFTHTVISLGYKFQPTYKFIFLSLGANFLINNLKVNSEKKEYVNGILAVDFQPPHPFSSNTASETFDNFHFINFPLEFGVGGIFQIKKITLKPAFYYTPCFKKGYNFYNVSMEMLFKFH